jgi:hypothetical protein
MVFLYPTVETASDAAATVMSAETEFPCHRSNAMNGKTAFVLLSSVLSGSLGACVQPPEAAAPRTGTGTCASPGSRADAQQPFGQYPEGDVRKAAGVITRRSGRGIAVLYRLSGSAVP